MTVTAITAATVIPGYHGGKIRASEEHERQSEGQSPLVVRARTSKASYKSLEPIVVAIEVQDAPGQSATIVQQKNPYQLFNFRVARTGGGKVNLTAFGGTYGSIDHGCHYVRSSGAKVRIRHRVPVNLLYDMTLPGEYTLVATIPYGEPRPGLTQERGAIRSAMSQPIKVIIEGTPSLE